MSLPQSGKNCGTSILRESLYGAKSAFLVTCDVTFSRERGQRMEYVALAFLGPFGYLCTLPCRTPGRGIQVCTTASRFVHIATFKRSTWFVRERRSGAQKPTPTAGLRADPLR